MNILNLRPNTDEWYQARHRDLTATDMAAFYDPKATKTPLQLFYEKQKASPPAPYGIHDSIYIRLEAGKYLEPFVARIYKEKFEYELKPFDGYVRHERVMRMGCTPDYVHPALAPGRTIAEVYGNPNLLQPINEEDGEGMAEIKTMNGMQYTTQHADGEPPLYHLVQLQHQLACTGLRWGMVITLVDLYDVKIHAYRADPSAIADIERTARKFWGDVAANREPVARGGAEEARLIKELYPSMVEEPADMTSNEKLFDLCNDYYAAYADMKAGEEKAERYKNRVVQIIKNHKEVTCGPFLIRRHISERHETISVEELDTGHKERVRIEELEDSDPLFQIAMEMQEEGRKSRKVNNVRYSYDAGGQVINCTIREMRSE